MMSVGLTSLRAPTPVSLRRAQDDEKKVEKKDTEEKEEAKDEEKKTTTSTSTASKSSSSSSSSAAAKKPEFVELTSKTEKPEADKQDKADAEAKKVRVGRGGPVRRCPILDLHTPVCLPALDDVVRLQGQQGRREGVERR